MRRINSELIRAWRAINLAETAADTNYNNYCTFPQAAGLMHKNWNSKDLYNVLIVCASKRRGTLLRAD